LPSSNRQARRSSALLLTLLLSGACTPEASGQAVFDLASAPPSEQHQEHTPATASSSAWTFAWDGVLFGTFNNQGGSRGETEFRSQNWAMASATRPLGVGTFGLTGMISLEPLTAPGRGFSEIFQVGEAYQGLQITDHQHPHDFFMQLAASWSVALGTRSRLTFVGAPVGEPALGPVAFMHRASAAENPLAPLAHHIFDSTHIASSVILGRYDLGILSVEGSAFHGREPDEHHYDLEFGSLDSWSTRVWLRPTPGWLIQGSYGFLEEPESLEPGDQRRANASASWSRHRTNGFTAVTAALGRNERQFSRLHSFLIEGTHKFGPSSIFGRYEGTQVETEILLFPQIVHVPHPGELVDRVHAFTIGGVRDLATIRGAAIGVGGDVTFYGVPTLLENTHDAHPVSFQLFFRVAPANAMRRMWDMTMAQHGGGSHQHH
jgi:hypothetical protein